jgi:hypothetical protein
MPMYAMKCDNGHDFDVYLKFAEYDKPQFCSCGRPATRQIRAPMVFVQPDISYTSPVDGRPVTNKHARIEDLKRHGCIPYDEGMKQDYQRRLKDGEAQLDKQVDETVDRMVREMPTRKREKLESELRADVNVETARITPEQQSARTQ